MLFSKNIIQTIETLQQEIINSNKSKTQSNNKPEREISNPTTGTRIL